MRVKRIILPILLALIISLSGLALFGCGSKSSSADVFKNFDQTMKTFEEDRSTFVYQTNLGITSSYALHFIGYKEGQKDELVGYQHYSALVGAGIGFIKTYYPKLEASKVKTNFKSLNESVTAMKKSYQTMKVEHEKIVEIKADTSIYYEIYNGYFYNYRRAIADFIDKVYACANSLANHLDKDLNLAANVGTDNALPEATAFYLDQQFLKIETDFKNLFMTSYKGYYLSDKEAFKNSLEVFSNFNENYYTKQKVVDASAEVMARVVSLFKSLQGNRDDVNKAIKELSMYDYYNIYDGSIIAYRKVNENAAIHFDQLNGYFLDTNSVLSRALNLLNLTVINNG